ncbi:BatD family protein [Corallincola platygyrae]
MAPNPVFVEERFVLTIKANTSADDLELDRDAMLRQGLIVGSTNVSRNLQIINGDSRRETTWRTELYARKAGVYTLPAPVVDGVVGKQIKVDVRPIPKQTGPARDLFVDAELSSDTAYIGQQVTYTVKLYLGEELRGGSLADPQMPNAEIRSIGSDKESSEIIDGRRYQVIARSFAIIPEQAGTFTIKGANVKGQLVKQNSRGQLYGMPVNESALDQQLTVKSQPESYQGHWLPAELVTLNDEWQPQSDTLNIGEPVTRTITLSAVGINDKLLPKLQVSYPNSVKVYPDKTDNDTYVQDQNLIAQRVESVALIPTQPGSLTFPALKIQWWDTKAEVMRIAELPARTIDVVGNGQAPAGASPSPLTQTTQVTSSDWLWPFWIMTLLWMSSTGVAIWLWVNRRPATLKDSNAKAHAIYNGLNTGSDKQKLKQLLRSINGQSATESQKQIQAWCLQQGYRHRQDWLSEFKQPEQDGITKALKAMDNAVQQGSNWSSDALVAAIIAAAKQQNQPEDSLQTFYPTR